MIGTQPGKYQRTECWDHPDYNNGRRGWLTRGAAIRIQKKRDKEWLTRSQNEIQLSGRLRRG